MWEGPRATSRLDLRLAAKNSLAVASMREVLLSSMLYKEDPSSPAFENKQENNKYGSLSSEAVCPPNQYAVRAINHRTLEAAQGDRKQG